MRILVYKRTHNGDPDQNGCFGAYDCIGAIRDRDFDAVIGVGGIGQEARANRIAGKVNWIGIGPHKTYTPGKRGPEVTFDQFRDFVTDGPDFRRLAPTLAERMYSLNIRHVMDDLSEQEYNEVIEILKMAEEIPSSTRQQPLRKRTCPPRRCPPDHPDGCRSLKKRIC
jgi:hypothetical protein